MAYLLPDFERGILIIYLHAQAYNRPVTDRSARVPCW
jgi:hypothetical protein